MKNPSLMKPLIAPIAVIGIFCLPQLAAAALPGLTIRWNDTHQRITGFGALGGNDLAGSQSYFEAFALWSLFCQRLHETQHRRW